MKLAAHGIRIELPAGWSGRLFSRQGGAATLHAGNFPLALNDGEFGDRSTPCDASRWSRSSRSPSTGPATGLQPGVGLFAARADPAAARSDRVQRPGPRAPAARPGRARSTSSPPRGGRSACTSCSPEGASAGAGSSRSSITCSRRCGSIRAAPAPCEMLTGVGAERGIDRRAFIAGVGASVVAIAAEAGCASDSGQGRDGGNRPRAPGAGRREGAADASAGDPRPRVLPRQARVLLGLQGLQRALRRRDPAGGRAPDQRRRREPGGPVVRRQGRADARALGRPQLRRLLDAVRTASCSISARCARSASTTSAGTATIGAGAQLIDVYAGLAARGATIPGGSCPSVGISGRDARRRDGAVGEGVRADRRQPRRDDGGDR